MKMNNNIPASVNSNSPPSSSSAAAMSKNVKKANGTTDNTSYYANDTTLSNNAAVTSSSSDRDINELPCNTCQRSGGSTTTVPSSSDVQNQPSSSIQQQIPSSQSSHSSKNVRQHVLPPNMSTTDDEEEGGDSDDQYCIYTYKGDGSSQHPSRLAADLPSSFFKFHPSDSSHPSSAEMPTLEPSTSRCTHSNQRIQNGSVQSPESVNQNNNAMYSPDMDFLEMDFDPGGSGDGCCDGDDEDDDEDVVRDHLHLSHLGSSGVPPINCTPRTPTTAPPTASGSGNNNNVLNDDHATAAVVLSKLVVTRSNGGGACISSDNTIRDSLIQPVAHCSRRITSNIVDHAPSSSVRVHNPITDNLLNCSTYSADVCRTDEIKLRLVKSVTLPEMGTTSCKSSTSGCYSGGTCSNNPTNRAMAMSISAPVFQDKLEGPFPTVIPAGKSSENSVELEVDGVMIWSIQEAREISINQIGRSACGATACLNVLSALGCIMTTLSPEFVNNCVGTRLRAEDAELPEYLLSRSNAGTTQDDLIAGIHRASNGLIYGRFFHIKPDVSPSTLNKWLLHWICKGAVPIATLNLQVRRSAEMGSEIPDSWHHQMIFGVTKLGMYLTNPLECVPICELIPQLSSESVLLVRRDDVTRRKGPRTDLRKLARFSDPRWNEMNVLGQVSNMLLEEMPVLNGSAGLARRIRTTHISIPAAYKSGITLFIRESNTTSCALLKAAPEL